MSQSSGSLFFMGIVIILIIFQVTTTINFWISHSKLDEIIEKQQMLIDNLIQRNLTNSTSVAQNNIVSTNSTIVTQNDIVPTTPQFGEAGYEFNLQNIHDCKDKEWVGFVFNCYFQDGNLKKDMR